MRSDKFRGNVFVANLPPGYTDAKLAERFDAYGLVLGAFLARDAETGTPKNHGLVMLAPDSAVTAAIAELNGSELGGRRLEVRRADPNMGLSIPRPSRRSPPRLAPTRSEVPRAFKVEYVKTRL
jgi:RNA recognition motif-containing protein